MRCGVLFVLAIAFVGRGDADDRTAIRRARADVDRVLAVERVPGISVAVVRDGTTVWAEGRGHARLDPRIAASASTVYEIGSLGKQFTAVMAERAAARGQLDLDAPLGRYLPGIPTAWSAVTLRRLLVHQAGVAQIAPPDRDLIDLRRDYTPAEYTAIATSVPLEFAPGTANAYSDTGYVLLGFALDRALGRFYGDALEAEVFRPLGMGVTRIIDLQRPAPGLAEGYERTATALQPQRPVSRSLNRTADGSLWSSVEDLARWEAALDRGTVLPAATLGRMWSPAALANGQPGFYHYGEGWEQNRLRDQAVVEYDGSWQGFHGAMARYPVLHLAVIALGNLDDWRAQRLVHDIAGRFDPRARPFRRSPGTGGCERALTAWLDRHRDIDDALGRELRTVGAIRDVHLAEAVPGDTHTAVYRVRATGMDDWMTVRCVAGVPALLDISREY